MSPFHSGIQVSKFLKMMMFDRLYKSVVTTQETIINNTEIFYIAYRRHKRVAKAEEATRRKMNGRLHPDEQS